LPELKGWKKEKFALPPQFAPAIPFKGSEDIRFSPEWAKKHTEGYWTYCFLWSISDAKTLSVTVFEKSLHDYYTGLIKTNLKEAKIDTTIATPVKVQLHKSTADKTDRLGFEGKVEMMDYMTQDPIVLNFRIHVKKEIYWGNFSAIFFEASPQPYSHKVWVEMDEIGNGIK
jgi:hypothetical protein